MAYDQVSVTLGPRLDKAAHRGGSAGAAVSGDVFVAWDTTNVTTLSKLRTALDRAVEIAAQGKLRDI